MDVSVGIDCGATNCRMGVVDGEGQLLSSAKFSSPLKTHPDQFGQIIKEHLDKLIKPEFNLKAIGVGTPGPLDLENGLLLPSSNIGNKENIDLKGQLDAQGISNVYFDRDTNVALMGEAWVGAAAGDQDVIMLTLGSGVGGALLINGEIERGVSGKAGEIGHTLIRRSEDRKTGRSEESAGDAEERSRESTASELASEDAPEIPKRQDPREIPVCGLGHQGCLEAWINSAKGLDELSEYLGIGLANIVDIFNPQKIIIGGGKINLGDFLTEAIEVMKDEGIKGAVDEVKVLYAKLGDNSGVYGAAKLAMNNLNNANI